MSRAYTVVTDPVITQHPVGQSVEEAATLVLQAGAAGTEPLTYQWRKAGLELADDGRIGGSTADTLTVLMVELSDAGLYDVVVTNDCGSVASAAAAVAVDAICPGDLDGDGVIDLTDLGILLINFGAACP